MGQVVLLAWLAAVLFLLPLPYGAVDEWSIFAFEAATVGLWLLYLVIKTGRPQTKSSLVAFQGRMARSNSKIQNEEKGRQARQAQLSPECQSNSQANTYLKLKPLSNHQAHNFWSRLILALVVIFLVVNLFQIIPLPASVVRLLSPQKFSLVERSTEVVGSAPSYIALSVSPALSQYEFLKYICYFIFGFLILRVVRSRREIQALVLVMLAAGLFQAIYGLAEYLGGTGRIFGYKNIWGRGSAFGTFINRNHYAGFLEMIFSLGLGFLLARSNFFALKKGVTWRQKIIWFGHERLQQAILFGALTVVLGIGLLFSRSRSGVIIFFLTFFLMMLGLSIAAQGRYEHRGSDRDENNGGHTGKIWTEKEARLRLAKREARREKEKSRAQRRGWGTRRLARTVRTVTLAVIFVAIFIGLRPIIERFTLESIWREARPKLYVLTWRMVADYPLFGTGAGTYIYAYTPYETQDLHGILHHAHNDYLETLAEMGFIGGGSIILAAFLGFGLLFGRWLRLPEKDYFGRGVGLGLLGGIVAILIHSLSDFNLRVPANAVYFICFYALAWRLLNEKRHED